VAVVVGSWRQGEGERRPGGRASSMEALSTKKRFIRAGVFFGGLKKRGDRVERLGVQKAATEGLLRFN